MESECSLETVRQLLVKMQSGEVRDAEEALKKLTTHSLFFSHIFFVLMSPQQQEWVKTMAASFLNQVFGENTNEQNCESVFEALGKVLMEPGIKALDKRIFEKSIIKAMEESSLENKQKWVRVVAECLRSPLHYDTAYLLIACLAVADIPPTIIREVIDQTYEQILTSLPVTVDNANLLNEMLKMWIVVLDKLKAEEEPDLDLMGRMVRSPCLAAVINAIYELEASEGQLICYREGLEELNFLKYEAAQLNKRMLEHLSGYSDEAFPWVIEFTKRNLAKIASSLISVASARQKIQDLSAEDLVTSLLSVMRHYLTYQFEEFKLDDVKGLVNLVIFPLLAIDDAERHSFEESPEEFNTLTEDCCDKQTYGILKTEAAKLLERFGDRVDDLIKYILSRSIESLKARMGYVQCPEYPDLAVLEIETALLALSVFSYKLSQFPEELGSIRNILNDQRCKSFPPLELSRVFTFLAYNYNEVYPNPAEGESWLRLILNYSAHPTTLFCAFDCFSNIIEDYFTEPLLGQLTDQISTGQLGLIWEIVAKVIENHFRQISGEGIGALVAKVFLRVQREVGLLERGGRKDTLDLINCLRLLGSVLRQMRKEEQANGSASTKRDCLVSQVWPVLELYQLATKYDIEDEVVKVATEMVNAMEGVVAELRPYLNQFLGAFRKNGFSEKVYLKFLNQYLLKADFHKSMQEVILILIALKDGLFQLLGNLTDRDGKLKSMPYIRLSLSNTMLIVQNSLAVHGAQLVASLNTDFFHEISSFCLRFLPRQPQDLERTTTGRILQSRAFNMLFLCHMHIKVDSVYDYLALLQTQKVYHGYDTAVLAICVKKQVFSETDLAGIVRLLSGLVRVAELSSEKQDLMDKNKRREKRRTKVNTHLKTIQDFDKIIKTIDTPFKKEDSVSDLLTALFAEMKNGNLELYRNILQLLPQEDIERYQQFVDFQQLEKKPRKIYKVVGVKLGWSQPTLPLKQMREDSDDEDNGLKRQRMKVKAESKGKKMLKGDHKRKHAEQQ